MDTQEAIRRAEQWRKDGACGPAAVVAIALLNELERAIEVFIADAMLAELKRFPSPAENERVRAIEECIAIAQGEHTADPFGDETQDRIIAALRNLLANKRERVSRPDTRAQAQSKVNDDMLAAQRNLLLREDGYPNAPVRSGFYPTTVTLAVSDGFGPHPGTTST